MLRKTSRQLPLALPYLITLSITILLFWPTWLRLLQEWLKWEQVLTHGLPTFLIFIGLILIHPPLTWQRNIRASGVGGALLVLLATLWGLLELVRIDTLAYLILPPGMLSVCWTLYGFRAALKFLPHTLLFSLSLPIWTDLVPHLVDLASLVVGNFVSLLGITALIEGANITLPYGRLVIADGCSGIRYLTTSLLLAAVTANLNDYRLKGWLIALSVAVLLALVVNWIRISALVVIAYYSNMESSLVSDHEFFGWMIFALVTVPALYLVPVHKRTEQARSTVLATSKKAFFFIALAILIGPVGISIVHSAAKPTPALRLTAPAHTIVSVDSLPIRLSPPESMTHEAVRFIGGGWGSIAQSSRVSREDKLVPYISGILDLETGSWFSVADQSTENMTIYQNLTTRKRVAVSQIYMIGSFRANSYRAAKLLQIPAILSGQNHFVLLTFQAMCSSRSCEDATDTLKRLRNEKTLTAHR